MRNGQLRQDTNGHVVFFENGPMFLDEVFSAQKCPKRTQLRKYGHKIVIMPSVCVVRLENHCDVPSEQEVKFRAEIK